MAFVIPALTAIGGAGAGAAAAGGIAGSGISFGTALAAAGTGLQTFAGFQQSRFQQQVLANNALIEEQNAQRAIEQASLEAQDADLRARSEIGQLIAAQAASGLDLGSGSFQSQRVAQDALAAQDRGRIVFGGETEAAAALSRASDFRSQSAQAGRAGTLGLISGAIGIGSDLISGATRTSRSTNRRLTGGQLRPRSRPTA